MYGSYGDSSVVPRTNRTSPASGRRPSGRTYAGSYRFIVPTISRTDAFSAAATISRPSATVRHMGFSTKTCDPARHAAIAGAAWLPDVRTITTSRDSATRSFQSVNTLGAATLFETAEANRVSGAH